MLPFFFYTTGHFLLLNPSPAEKDAGICKYHLTSPVLPGSDNKQCVFQLALYEAARAAGNITLLIKAVLSGSTVRSLSLNRTSRDDHRLAITEIVLIHIFVQHSRARNRVSVSSVRSSIFFGSFLLIFHRGTVHQLKAPVHPDSASAKEFLYNWFRQKMAGCAYTVALCIMSMQ